MQHIHTHSVQLTSRKPVLTTRHAFILIQHGVTSISHSVALFLFSTPSSSFSHQCRSSGYGACNSLKQTCCMKKIHTDKSMEYYVCNGSISSFEHSQFLSLLQTSCTCTLKPLSKYLIKTRIYQNAATHTVRLDVFLRTIPFSFIALKSSCGRLH